jgi:hypothetical protein
MSEWMAFAREDWFFVGGPQPPVLLHSYTNREQGWLLVSPHATAHTAVLLHLLSQYNPSTQHVYFYFVIIYVLLYACCYWVIIRTLCLFLCEISTSVGKTNRFALLVKCVLTTPLLIIYNLINNENSLILILLLLIKSKISLIVY